MTPTPVSQKVSSGFKRSLPALKFFGLCFLVLLLGIPTMIVGFLSSDRQSEARRAAGTISSQWGGGKQVLSGPYLLVPYNKIRLVERTERRKGCKDDDENCEFKVIDRVSSRSYVSIAADVLTGATSLKTQIRHRGIYDVPVYTATTQIKGEFEPKDLNQLLEPEDEVLWDQAFISVLVSERRTFQNKAVLNWNGAKLTAEPGPVGRRETLKNNISGIHFQGLNIDPAVKNVFDFELVMQGALNFGVIPNGRQVNWTLDSDWPDPSFSGLFLPTNREISKTGFTANWKLPQIARQQASIQRADKVVRLLRLAAAGRNSGYAHLSGGGEFNVKLFTPVDLYSQVDRALKYALLFIGMLMLSLYLIELVGRDQAVHVVQHLFVGMANVVFYLLLLSFSEQIGFNLAYLIAASATIGLIGGYCSVILKERRRAAIVGVVLVAVYVLLWALLNLADYALIVGSLMVFAALAITMYATRNINWYNARETDSLPSASAS
jgi:inner membrane protein